MPRQRRQAAPGGADGAGPGAGGQASGGGAAGGRTVHLQWLRGDMDKEVRQDFLDAVRKALAESRTLPEAALFVKVLLDKLQGTGWCVFAGSDVTLCVRYQRGTHAAVEVPKCPVTLSADPVQFVAFKCADDSTYPPYAAVAPGRRRPKRLRSEEEKAEDVATPPMHAARELARAIPGVGASSSSMHKSVAKFCMEALMVSAATSPNLVDACKALKKRMQEQYGATFQVVAASRSSVGCPSHIVDGFLELNVQRLRFNARKYLKQHPHLADDDALACDTGAADDADGGSGAGGEKDPPDMKVFVFKSLPFLTLTAGLKQRDSWWNKVRIALWVCAGMALAAYLYVSTFCSTLCLGAQPPLADTTDDAAEFDDADGVLRCPQEDIGASETCRWKIRVLFYFALAMFALNPIVRVVRSFNNQATRNAVARTKLQVLRPATDNGART